MISHNTTSDFALNILADTIGIQITAVLYIQGIIDVNLIEKVLRIRICNLTSLLKWRASYGIGIHSQTIPNTTEE